MSQKNIKTYYYYPLIKIENNDKILDLSPILNGLSKISPEKRVLIEGEENIQLKKMTYYDKTNRWELAFLRNQIDAPFKSKLNDHTDTAESLEDDEFVGHECCAIYDENTNIISIQNNRYSTSFNGIASFFNKYSISKLSLSVITYDDKYSNISDSDSISYRSIIIGYTDISKLIEIYDMSELDSESKDVIKMLSQLSNSMAAINGKVELNVGRTKGHLNKSNLGPVTRFLKKDKNVTKSLKVKMTDGDTIRVIDLLNNKVYHEFKITVTKDQPKTFQRILDEMNASFDNAINECFDKCAKFTNI